MSLTDPRFRIPIRTAEQPWNDQALCTQVDPDLWFPDMGGPTGRARRICAKCPVRAECLAYALEHNETAGVWGGTTPVQRKAMRRGAA